VFNKKILCLGNNSIDTDIRTSIIATENQTINHGLISDSNYIPQDFGYYHTSIADVYSGGVIQLANQFDTIILLDQPLNQWSHWKLLLSTYKIMVELEKAHDTVFRNNQSIKSILFMHELLTENKSFCMYPWMHLLEEYGDVFLCSKSKIPIKKLNQVVEWKTDKEFNVIRKAMSEGKQLTHCELCHEEESLGFTSTRVHESLDYAVKFNITSLKDLEKFERPAYYEVRPGNKCNLQCRMCCPENSDLIEKEFKKINIEYPSFPKIWGNYDHIEVEKLIPQARIYSTGGEPTIIPAFYEFLEKCVSLGRTDLDINLNTNGQKVSKKLIDICSKFDHVNFSFSIDGYGRVNDYIRTNSDWETTIKNAKLLKSHGFYISLECIPSLWNITNLHLLYEFYDREFPGSTVFLQQVYWPDPTMNVFNHPNPKLVVESLTKVTQTSMYHTDARDNKSIIDTLLEHYSKDPKPDLQWLRKFYEFNDKLDVSRNVRLADYVPELEECRKYIL
jgi:sulfatase maturation enzyme AslB (radical SAM superfamily)